MKEWVMAKTDVRKDLLKESQQKAIAEFSVSNNPDVEAVEGVLVEDDDNWTEELKFSADGMKALSTLSNII